MSPITSEGNEPDNEQRKPPSAFDKYGYDAHGFDRDGNEIGPVLKALRAISNEIS